MKNWRFLGLVVMAILVLAGASFADTLAVNNAAAMGGTGTACGGSNCGLAVTHDNTSAAFVQDDSPASESMYRGSFLFNPNNVNASATRNFRQLIFSAKGPNPNPGVGNCTTLQFIDPLRIWYFPVGGVGQNSTMQIFAFGNQCGARGSTRIPIASDQPVKVCFEWSTGNSSTGRVDLAIVGTTAACPSSGDAAWNGADITNGLTSLDFVRMGIPATNNFAAGESGTFYFDEFESFRTLTP